MDSASASAARAPTTSRTSISTCRAIALVVITGLSGSGKSSLAFDTLYAEGQRRYVESLSAYARQFLQLMEKPDVDLIEGLSPAIAIEQKAASHNPRSTVGTVTEIHDYLRLLFARVGTPYCPEHELALRRRRWRRWSTTCCALPEDTRLMVLAPVVAGRKGEQAELFDELRAQGFARVRIDGKRARARRRAAAGEEREAHDRGRDRPPARARRRQAAPRRIVRDGAAARRRQGACVVETDSEQASTCSRRSSPARSATTRCPSSSRACSRSTTRWAPARAATAWARSSSSIRSASSRIPNLSLASGAIRGWDRRNHFYFSMLQSLAQALRLRHRAAVGDARRARPEARAARLGQARRSPSTTSSERGRAQREGARLRGRHAEPRAALPRDRLARGARGARQAASTCRPARIAAARGCGARRATSCVAERDHLRDLDAGRCAQTLHFFAAAAAAGRQGADRRAHRARDRQPPAVPDRRRPRLPVARALGRDALRRRGAAHPPREPDRLGPHRRDVRARRALDRPAPARQRAPHRARSSTCATSATP